MGIPDNLDVDSQRGTLLSKCYGGVSTVFSNLRNIIWTDNVNLDKKRETLLAECSESASTLLSNLRKMIWTNNVPYYEPLISVFCQRKPYFERVAFDAKRALSNCSNEDLEEKK